MLLCEIGSCRCSVLTADLRLFYSLVQVTKTSITDIEQLCDSKTRFISADFLYKRVKWER